MVVKKLSCSLLVSTSATLINFDCSTCLEEARGTAEIPDIDIPDPDATALSAGYEATKCGDSEQFSPDVFFHLVCGHTSLRYAASA